CLGVKFNKVPLEIKLFKNDWLCIGINVDPVIAEATSKIERHERSGFRINSFIRLANLNINKTVVFYVGVIPKANSNSMTISGMDVGFRDRRRSSVSKNDMIRISSAHASCFKSKTTASRVTRIYCACLANSND